MITNKHNPEFNFSYSTVAVLLLVLCIIFYGNTLNHTFSLDDDYVLKYLPENKHSILHLFDVFKHRFDYVDYRPIPLLTFALEQYLFGSIRPFLSHLINVLLFFTICLSLFSFLSKLPISHSGWLALFITIVFLSHPVHANTVNNLKSRDTLLSCLFCILSNLYWLKSFKSESKFNLKYVLISIIYLLVALFCKLDSMLYFIILLLSFLLFRKQQKLQQGLIYIFLFFAVSIIFRNILTEVFVPAEPEKALGVLFMENPIVRTNLLTYKIGQSAMTLFWYLKFMLIPKGYFFYFGYDTIPLYTASHIITLLLVCLHFFLLFLATYFLYTRKNILIGFGIFYFYISLAYCSNLYIPVAGIVADRYAFIASVGFCIVAGTLLFKVSECVFKSYSRPTKKTPDTPFSDSIKFVLPLVFVSIFFLPFVWGRNTAWKNMSSLLEKDMPHLKKSYEANRIATATYLKQARIMSNRDSAVQLLNKGLNTALQANKIFPNEIFILESIGIANMSLGNTGEALKAFRKVLQLTDSSLVSCDTYGDYLLRNYQFDSAAYYYYKTIKILPQDPEGYYKYNTALLYAKRYNEAIQFGDSIIHNNPEFYVGYECKGFAYLNMKDTLHASDAYQKAFEHGMRSDNIASFFYDYFTRRNAPDFARKFTPYLSTRNRLVY